MRITRLGPTVPLLNVGLGSTTQMPPSGPSGQVPTSNGSNGVAWGSNVAIIYANGSNAVLGPFVNFASGSGITLAVSSNTMTVTSTGAADTSNLLTKNEGGGDTVFPHGPMGATETFDPTDGNVHTGTLNANCTVTLSAPVGSGEATIEGWFTQSGGPWTLAFAATAGSFVWDGTTPTLPTTGTFRVILQRIPGTANDWVGSLVGSTASTTVTAATITALGFTGPILIADAHSSPLVFADLLQNDDLTDLLYADL